MKYGYKPAPEKKTNPPESCRSIWHTWSDEAIEGCREAHVTRPTWQVAKWNANVFSMRSALLHTRRSWSDWRTEGTRRLTADALTHGCRLRDDGDRWIGDALAAADWCPAALRPALNARSEVRRLLSSVCVWLRQRRLAYTRTIRN